jgi:hypothetical protein
LLLGFWDITEFPRVWLGVVVPVQSGTVFGVPEPVTCAEAIADKAIRGKVLKNRNPNRCIVVLLISDNCRRIGQVSCGMTRVAAVFNVNPYQFTEKTEICA